MIQDATLLASLGFTEQDFCSFWQISERTLSRWKKKRTDDLCQAIEKGRLEANISATKALFNKVQEGNMTAIIFWLTNRCPEIWADRRAVVNNINAISNKINVAEDNLKLTTPHAVIFSAIKEECQLSPP